jgi:hypothetical protein
MPREIGDERAASRSHEGDYSRACGFFLGAGVAPARNAV